MMFPDFHFDPHLPSFIHHTEMLNYLKQYAVHFSLMPIVQINTVVTSVKPTGTSHHIPLIGDDFYGTCEQPRRGFSFDQWKVTTQNVVTKSFKTEIYDAVLICNGHYSTPFTMDVPGLEHFPSSKILHSHSYRDPELFQDQVVLVVGAGSSGKDIILDVSTKAAHVVLSSRKVPISCPLPSNIEQRGEVEQILPSGAVLFKDGRTLSPDTIIICNGYDFDFPFLDDDCGISIGGRMIYPLFKHIFNSANPSMAFLGVNITVLPFPYFDLQARWVFSVWAGFRKLPSAKEMVADCDQDWEKRQAAGIPRRYAHVLRAMQWDYYHEVAVMGANQPLDHVIQKLYDTVYQYRVTDLWGYKDYRFAVTGYSSFLLLSDSTGPTGVLNKIKVAVIGAGVSGLCAARHCCKFGDHVSVIVYEQGTEICGKLASAVCNGLTLNKKCENFRSALPCDLMGFQDFAFPPNAGSFPCQSQVTKYLEAYSRQYGLLQHVKFNHVVDHVSLQESGAKHRWLVKVTDLANQTLSCEEFDCIFISTECFCALPVEGLDQFPLEHVALSHAHLWTDNYKNKVILVLGSNSTTFVTLREVASIAKEVIWCSRQPSVRDLPDNVSHRPHVARIGDGQMACFSDGTSRKVDDIIVCAGLKHTFPFLDGSNGCNLVSEDEVKPLYKLTFNPCQSTMAFLGAAMDTSFAYCDMQVMWALRVWLGEQPLPQTSEMIADCKGSSNDDGIDLASFYKELAQYSNTRPPTPALLSMLREKVIEL